MALCEPCACIKPMVSHVVPWGRPLGQQSVSQQPRAPAHVPPVKFLDVVPEAQKMDKGGPKYFDVVPNAEKKAEKIGKADANVILAEDTDAELAQIPKDVRARFATKVWTLLAAQMCVTFILSLVVEIVARKPDDPGKGVMIWIASAVVAFVIIGVLRYFRDKPGVNYVLLGLASIFMAIFWGLTKFVVHGFFNINVTGIVTLSLLLSALCNRSGITESLGEKLAPSGDQSQRAPESMDQQSLVTEVKLHKDGVTRATLLLGIVTWLIAFIVCLAITLLLTSMTQHADMTSACAAGVLAFFMLLFFHHDCDRHMRKCDFDKPLKAIISVNCDIVLIFLLIYQVAVFLACNEMAVEMQGDGAGGGDVGVDADGGGMEGGAGADAAGAEPEDVDRVYGGDGV